jgi:hypothetical protein
MDFEFEMKSQTIGTLFIIFACFQPLVLFAGFMAFTMAAAGTFAAPSVDDPALKGYTVMALMGVILMPLSIILFVIALVAGICIKKRKPCGRIWGMIAAVLALLEIPVGTVLGVYALCFFKDERSKPIDAQQNPLV